MATKQIARPSASKTCIYVFTDNNTVTYNITRNSKGGLFCCAVQQTLFILCAILNSSALLFAQPKGAGEETAAGADRQHRGTGLCAGHSAASAC